MSVNERIIKLWYIHTMKYYSAIKRLKLLIHATTWINIQGIMLWGGKKGPQSLYTALFHIFRYLKWQKFRNGEQISGWKGLRRGWGRRVLAVAIKGNMRDCVGDGSIVHLDYINVKILVMKVYYSSTRLNS